MQLRNDYAKGVYNGEVGTVCWVGTRLNDEGRNVPAIKVDYSGYEAAYTDADVNDLEQAWAATVHKLQGCEFPVVIFVCPPEHRRMLTRRSEEHTSELQSLMRISYAVFCLKKKRNRRNKRQH